MAADINQIRLVCFDLDDTLIASSAATAAAMRRLSQELLEPHRLLEAERVFDAWLSLHRTWWAEETAAELGRREPARARADILRRLAELMDLDPARVRYVERNYPAVKATMLRPVVGIHRTLRKLRTRNISIAVVTNGLSGAQQAKLRRFGLDRFTDCVVTEEDVGAPKPMPSSLVTALRITGVTPTSALFIGDDGRRDGGAAAAANVEFIHVAEASSCASCAARPGRHFAAAPAAVNWLLTDAPRAQETV